jgi:hypothetical protein
MTNLIRDLKWEHVVILDKLRKAKELGVTSVEGRGALQEAKKMLVAHLRKEDYLFYPTLKRDAERDGRLKRLVDSFADDMSTISKSAHVFFDTYRGGGSNEAFTRDFSDLYSTIWQRQENEEAVLYAEYEKRH